jgi:hypothetical protein
MPALGRRADIMRTIILSLLTYTLLVAQGCSLSDDSNALQDIALARVSVGLDTLITRDMYRVALVQGTSIWNYGPEEFADPHWTPSEVRLSGHGTLAMDFRIIADDGSVVSTGRMQWELRPDRRYLIALMRDDQRRVTMNPTSWVGFPITDPRYRVSEQDSIFLVWSSNSISHPVEY